MVGKRTDGAFTYSIKSCSKEITRLAGILKECKNNKNGRSDSGFYDLHSAKQEMQIWQERKKELDKENQKGG